MRELPLELQFLVLNSCDWEQHFNLSLVCKTWREYITSATASLKRYESILALHFYSESETRFERPRFHRILKKFAYLVCRESSWQPCFVTGGPNSGTWKLISEYPAILQDPLIWPDDIDEEGNGNPALCLLPSYSHVWFQQADPDAEDYNSVILKTEVNPTVGEFFRAIAENTTEGINSDWGEEWEEAALLELTIFAIPRTTGGYFLVVRLERNERKERELLADEDFWNRTESEESEGSEDLEDIPGVDLWED
ncbi:hypothetical protein ABW20_dc0104543 [Dactylellina cionopaga]|nr:hypothetical protein ABW20_dc0104543 [Dactylellina cionopaga]